jgi:hypothetical protein
MMLKAAGRLLFGKGPDTRDPAFDEVSRRLPIGLLRAILRESLRDLSLALYLHRVNETHRPTDATKGLTIKGTSLDVVLDELSALAPHTKVTVSFDDGYEDAVEYVSSRANRFADLRFLFNVCPEKLEQRAGFRWDLLEQLRSKNATPEGRPDQFLWQGARVAEENSRKELIGLGDTEPFRMASIAQVQALAKHPNVELGNHSNCHFPLARLDDEEMDREIRTSKAMFERHFGPMRHFAFPFGYPGLHFGMREVALLRELGAEHIWCTKESPYASSWDKVGAVLPRIQLVGTWTVKHMLLWIAQRAAVYRIRRARGVSLGEIPI